MSVTTTDNLFTPVKVGAFELKHRIVLPAMSRLRANWPSGTPSTLMREYYGMRAADGGMLIAEGTAVSPEGRAYHTGPGIWSDEQVIVWKSIVDDVHTKGGIMLLQLTHAGRATGTSITKVAPVAPSVSPTYWENKSVVVSTAEGFTLPSPHRALEVGEIEQIVDQFRAAALNAKRAGFDGIELLAGNAHLIEQFLHDSSNQRDDLYGGSVLNRSRFLFQIVDAVAKVWGSDRVGVRISPSSVFAGMGDSDPHRLYRQLATFLSDKKIAYLHVIEPRISGADTVLEGQAPVATDELRHHFTGPIIAAGGFHPDTAEAAITAGIAQLVAFGRHFTSNPDLPRRIKLGLPLTPYDRSTFYAFDAKGYTEFQPYLEQPARAAE